MIMGQNSPAVSIVIPAHGKTAAFGSCLRGVFGSDFADFECLVVDDGSPDDLGGLLKSYPVKLVRLEERRGPAFARNRGAEAASSDIIFFLDSDVEPHRDAVGKVVAFMREHPSAAAVFGSYDDAPVGSDFFSQYRNLFHHYTHQVSREKALTFWAGCGAVRRDALRKVGGFDENYTRPCVEDIELGYRLNRGGFDVRLDKTLQVTHHKRWTFAGLVRADIFDRALPWTALLMQHGKMANDLNITITARVSALLLFVAVAGLGAGVFWRPGLICGFALVLLVVFLNRSVYIFYREKRGLWFALRAIPMHLLYMFYSGLAFLAGSVIYKIGRRRV